ncbi:unnamed protein product [Cladocopium goreaui]|uniref:Uncharacterized protein n=1 Tax=Cladocopium goreaui TaxID=2562237 RepID=A0A9P1CZ61_9DINO|nr:unnamed protein product [Cladocopium goreaui]
MPMPRRPGLGRRDHREPKSAVPSCRQIPSQHTWWQGSDRGGEGEERAGREVWD